MDPDVVEIPPIQRPSRFEKQKQAILHEVIDVDSGDDFDDLVVIGEKINKSNKGQTIEAIHKSYGDHHVLKVPDSNGHSMVLHDLINGDGHGSDQSSDDDEYMEIDEYSLLQAQFDNVDIPTGIEAYFPLDKINHVTDFSQPSRSLQPSNSKVQRSTNGSSSFQIKMDNVDCSSGSKLSSQTFSQDAPSKKKSATLLHSGCDLKHSSGIKSSKSQRFLNFPGKMKSTIFGSKKQGLVDNPETMKLLHAGKPPYLGRCRSARKAAGSSSSYHSSFIGQDGSMHPPGKELENPLWMSSHRYKPFPNNINTANPIHYPPAPFETPPQHVFGGTWVQESITDRHHGTAMDTPVLTITDETNDEILRKFQSFKKFDIVNDVSDHHYLRNDKSLKQNPKTWAKKVQEEWRILERDLPDSIFVRAYDSRMDLLRAVIIGAEGTPYHDGLFFFDVYFPSGYPNVPPLVHYHSGGLRLNPNLYNCGKVCLSLLNTWSGNHNEKWLPGISTILQVLVSIQGLILNTKPFFNEPGYERMSGSANGEVRSQQYNETTFILSLRTMMYMVKKPPKHFEDFVVGHFYSRAHDILVACKAYMEGAQVGCLVKGGVQNVDEGDKSCSQGFKGSLAGYVNQVVKELTRIGAKDCEKYLSPAPKVNKGLPYF